MSNAPDYSKPSWLTALDDTLATKAPDDEFNRILAGLIKEYLLCDDDGAAATFASRFDDLYGAVYEPRFDGYRGQKKGWTGFLHAFYSQLFWTSRQIRYNDPKQDQIIQLLSELRKLPLRTVKVFVQSELGWLDAEIWRRDPLLPSALLINMPREDPLLDQYNCEDLLDMHEFDQATTLWVDSNAFWARCTGAGFDEESKSRFAHAGSIIAMGLEPGYHAELDTKLDSHVMAAAQFLLHAGDLIDQECVRKLHSPSSYHSWKGFNDGNGPVVWKQWGERLGEIVAALESGGEPGFKLFEKNRDALFDMVIRARDKVVALEPEMFAQQSAPDTTSAGQEAEAVTEADATADAVTEADAAAEAVTEAVTEATMKLEA